MKSKRATALIVLIIGVVMIFFSNYIKGQVATGREEIESGQESVNRSNSLFSSNPLTKAVGQGITGSAQKKIEAGTAEADRYEMIANYLQIGGIILIILGGAGLIYSFVKKRK